MLCSIQLLCASALLIATVARAQDSTLVAARVTGRNFPSVFQPWNHVDNASMDLYWTGWQNLGLRLADGQRYPLLSPVFTQESIQAALHNRAAMLAANPNMIILAEVHYRTAPPAYLPPDSPYWIHDARFDRGNGRRYGNHRLDLGNPELQDKVADLCAALIQTGVYDGCLLDLWQDDDEPLLRKMRRAIGEQAILIANVNGRLPTRTARYLNGMYMEGFGATFFPDWRTAAANLLWGESHLHQPAMTALEGWWQRTGRNDLPLMHAVTTLSLVFSNGYVLFGDPNGPPDHQHDWYAFWNKSLGKPVEYPANLDRPDLGGAYTRRYERGEVVFNPPSNHPVTVDFPEPRRSAATNVTGRSFTVAPGDGDLFLTP